MKVDPIFTETTQLGCTEEVKVLLFALKRLSTTCNIDFTRRRFQQKSLQSCMFI